MVEALPVRQTADVNDINFNNLPFQGRKKKEGHNEKIY